MTSWCTHAWHPRHAACAGAPSRISCTDVHGTHAQKISARVQRTPPPPMCSSVVMSAWCSAATCRLQGRRSEEVGLLRAPRVPHTHRWLPTDDQAPGTCTGDGLPPSVGTLCSASWAAPPKKRAHPPQHALLVLSERVVGLRAHGQHRQAPPVLQLQHVSTKGRHLHSKTGTKGESLEGQGRGAGEAGLEGGGRPLPIR